MKSVLTQMVCIYLCLLMPSQANKERWKAPVSFVQSDPSGLILCPVDLGTIQTYFALDTGASPTLIVPEEIAKRLRLPIQPFLDSEGKPVLWANGRPMQYADSPEFTWDNIDFKGMPMAVFQDEWRILQTPPVQGIIGNYLLSGFALAIDFRAKELTLYHPGKIPLAELKQMDMDDASCITLTLSKDVVYYFPLSVNNHSPPPFSWRKS